METVRTQDVTFNDLSWKISYTPERCTMCGSCVAACTFNAIEGRIERRSITVSNRASAGTNAAACCCTCDQTEKHLGQCLRRLRDV